MKKFVAWGSPQNGTLDTVFVANVKREVWSMFTSEAQLLMQNITPGVLERILSIASEISVEVRRFASSQ